MLIVLAAIAVSSLSTDPSPRPSPAASPAATMAGTAPTRPATYCVREQMPVSRIARRECMTRAQWLERGFDPLRPAG